MELSLQKDVAPINSWQAHSSQFIVIYSDKRGAKYSIMIKVGDRIPETHLKTMIDAKMVDINTTALFAHKKVVLFGVPGAFTPGCSKAHLPGYVQGHDAIIARGFDTIACVAVNDAWVMQAWGESANAIDKVLMLADGSAQFAKMLGLSSDLTAAGMGIRFQRFSMIIEDGVVLELNVDGHYIQTTSADVTCGL